MKEWLPFFLVLIVVFALVFFVVRSPASAQEGNLGKLFQGSGGNTGYVASLNTHSVSGGVGDFFSEGM